MGNKRGTGNTVVSQKEVSGKCSGTLQGWRTDAQEAWVGKAALGPERWMQSRSEDAAGEMIQRMSGGMSVNA